MHARLLQPLLLSISSQREQWLKQQKTATCDEKSERERRSLIILRLQYQQRHYIFGFQIYIFYIISYSSACNYTNVF